MKKRSKIREGIRELLIQTGSMYFLMGNIIFKILISVTTIYYIHTLETTTQPWILNTIIPLAAIAYVIYDPLIRIASK